MKLNVGGADRSTRLVAGVMLLLIGAFVQFEMIWQIVVMGIGAIALVTGLVRFCPINALLGIDSSKGEKKK
jgi:hypothetical protein